MNAADQEAYLARQAAAPSPWVRCLIVVGLVAGSLMAWAVVGLVLWAVVRWLRLV